MAEIETKIELLRKKLSELRKERETVVFERGLAAEDNKDLRENATFDYWTRIEHNLTSQILRIAKEITELTHKNVDVVKKPKKAAKPKLKVVEKIKDLPRHRWR